MLRTAIVATVFFVTAFTLAEDRTHPDTSVRLTPDRTSCIYDVGEKIGWTVQLIQPGESTYVYEVRRDNTTVVASGEFSPPRDGDRIEASINQPGVLYLKVERKDGESGQQVAVASAAVAPRSINFGCSCP